MTLETCPSPVSHPVTAITVLASKDAPGDFLNKRKRRIGIASESADDSGGTEGEVEEECKVMKFQ